MIVDENIELQDLLSTLDNKNIRMIFLVNKNKQLTGCISQGDIIRLLIDGSSLKILAIDVANLNPIKIFYEKNKDYIAEAKKIITKKKVHAVPIVDKNNKIKSIISMWDILSKIDATDQ